jgi:hypothetical protein
VPGGDLYGRLGVIKRVIRSLGAKRSQAAFLVQAPRQMGKTSLLYFIRRQVPTHVFPVYVNLERLPSLAQGGGLWGLLTQRVLEEDAGHSIPQCASRRSEADLVDVVSEVCNRRHAAYALIMLDELHFLFDGCEHPAQALASFRDFLNSPDKRIALLLADRYTRVELERRCPSEYWAQLTDLDLGPLDVQSTRQAVEFPARGSDVIFLPSTASRLHQLTSGYPYHVQRGAQYLLDDLYAGPWLVALPDDVDEVVPRMLEQDVLFQSGLCRPDRVDAEIMDGVSALLEWKDLRDLLPALMAESPGEEGTLAAWQPDARAFLENVGDPDLLGQRLRSIGILNDQGDEFFSPLLEKWLRKMRRQQRNLAGDGSSATWQFTRFPDGGVPTARDWQNLDGLLAQRARSGGGTPPLRPKATRADDWDALVRDVTSEEGFRTFVDSAFRLLIDEREDKQALVRYPWLFLVYHRTRLVRNYVVHSSRTKAALSAWDAVCTSALGGERLGYWPTSGEEWHLMQMALLRMLHAGMRSAIASTVVAGQ